MTEEADPPDRVVARTGAGGRCQQSEAWAAGGVAVFGAATLSPQRVRRGRLTGYSSALAIAEAIRNRSKSSQLVRLDLM